MSKLNYGDMSWDDLLKSSLYMNATEPNKAAMQNEWLDSFMADFTQDEIQNDAPYLTDRLLRQTTVSQGQVYNALLRAGYRMPKQDAVAFNPEAYTPTVGDKVLDIYKGVGLSAQSGFAKGVNLLEAIPEAVARGNAALGSYAYPYEMKNGHATNIPNQTAKKYKEYSEKALDRMEKRTQEAREMLAKNNVNQAVWRPLLNGDFGEATQGALNSFVDGMVHQMFQAGLAWATGGLTSTALMGLSVQEEKYAELRHDNTHSELQKNAVATLDGIWEALFEHFGSEQIFKKLKMGEGSLLDAWRKDPSSKSMLKGVVKSMLGPFLQEGSEEFLTEVFQNMTDRLGQAHNLDEFKKLWKETNWWEIFHNAMEAGLAGGLIGLGMGAPSIVSQYKVIQAERNANAYSRAAFNYYMGNAKEDRMPAKYASEEQRREALDDYLKKGKPITFDEPTPQDWYRSYVARLSELEEQGIDMDSEGEDGDTYRKIRERFNAFVQTPEGKAVHDQIVAEYQQRIEQEAAQQAQQEQQEQPVEPPAPVEQQPVETPAPVEQPKENKFPTKQKVDPKSQYSVDYKPGETKIIDTKGEEAQVAVIGDKPQTRYYADEQSGVKGHWAVVDANALEISNVLNNVTQNRDMSTKQSREMVAAITNGLKNNPSQTLDSRTVDHGAPTVIAVKDKDGNTRLLVHFGNHRAQATINGYSDAETGQALRSAVTEYAQKNNIDITGIQNPMLVFIESEAQTVEQLQQGTQRGNHTATRQMTPSQNAQSDALLLAQHPEVLKKFVPGGNLATENFDFLRNFMQITDTMNAGLLDEKNRPTMEAENRVARAMFAYFLRNESPDRQERMLKSVIDNAGDNNIVSLVRGIMSNAPSLAQLEEKFPDYALGKEMINALDSYLEYKRARSKGEFNSIENWFNQTTMDFGDKNQKKLDLNDVEKDLARIFDKVKTIKGIRTFFNTFTDKVHEEAGGEGLFSDVQKRTKAEIIHDLAQKTLEPEEDTSGTTANASVENENTEHAPRVESARVADVTQEGNATAEAVQEKRKNIDDAVRVAQRLFPGYTIHIHDTVADIPDEHRAQIPKNGIPECYNDGKHGIHIIVENMPSDPATIRQRIMSHEIVGHDGLKQLLGKRYDKMLDSVYADHENDIIPIANRYHYAIETVEGRRMATEEWLAHNANIEDRPSWFNRLVAKIRATLRTMFNVKWSDNDIRSCFIEAARNLQEQSGSQHIRFALSDSQATLDAAAKKLGINLASETQEFRDVFKQYYGTPQWMKAPNGKPTNLTARQWVQVRTPAFKRWFGNWEAEFEEQRMRNTVKEWLSNENIEKARGKLRSEIFEMFGNDLEAVAHIPIEYLPYLSDGIEDNRVYSGKGYLIDHAVNHHPEVEITSYGNIQNIIDTADDVKLDNKNPGRNPSILFIKQVDPTGVVVVSFDEGENGKIVLHKSFFEKTKKGRFDKLPSIKNGANASLMVGNPIISPAADATAAVRRISALNDNNTINHGNYFVKSDFSKIVDENGEPMVVYHGTEGSFTVFDKTKGRANMDIQGMFFSPWEDDARGYGSRLMPCFLNIRHPAIEGQAYKALKAHQGENNAGVKAREDLIAQGFDGVNNENEEFIAFEPTQIKSATDNVGTFSNENPDIRFSLVTDQKRKKNVLPTKGVRFSLIGEDGASQLDKSEGVALRMDNLAIAKQMLQAKKDDLNIRLATGWERGADSKWRYEIDDSEVKLDNFGLAEFQRDNPDYAWLRDIEDRIFSENYEPTSEEDKRYEELSKKYNGIEQRALEKIKSYMGTRLSAILDYPELYKAYPHFKYMSVFFVPKASYEGKYDGAAFYLAVDVVNNELWSNAYVKSVLLHEIQHAIQQEEGFTRGSNPTKAGSIEKYNRVAGEVESRNAERRMLFPAQKRRSTLLSATEDIPRHTQTTDFEYPIKLGDDIVDSAKLDKMFFTNHSLSEDEWDAYNKYISYGPVVGKAKLEAMLQSGIETFVESAKKQLPIFERIEGVEPRMKEDEHIRWSLQQAESAKKRLSELWENGNIRQDEVISIGNVEANVQEASKKLGLELPDNLSFIIRGGELQHLKNDHPELTSQDIERLVTAWINPDYLGLALGKNVKKMFLITQDDSSDAMGVIIIGLQKKQAHLKTFYIAERSKLLNSLKQKSTPLVEVAKSPADDSLNHPLQPTEGAVRNTNSEVPVNSNILPTRENANPEAPKIKPSLVAEQPTPGNPDSIDQRIYADHVAKAVAQTPIENLRAMRLPLILELARKLKGDVKAVDRIPIDGARGVFYHGSRLIEVLRELAKPQLLEKDIIVPLADVARQRQLWEDYWTKAGVPLNEIEIVETPVGGDVRMHAIRHDRTLARFRKTAGHEVGHLIDYDTGNTTSHGNVLGTVGGMLKGWLMNVIGETPSTQVDKTSLNQLRRQLHKQAETMVGPKPNPADKAALDAWKQAVSDKYHELVVDECDRNAWFRREVVREEMVDLTRWWSGEFFGEKPSYVEYRQKPTELFAETMSVLLNAPDELMKRSPETWRLIQNYQSNKSEFHKAWRQLMDLMNDETAYAKSLLEIQRRGFDAGEVAALAAIKNNPSFSFEDSWMAFKRSFVNKFANVADASKQVVRNGQMVFDDTPLSAITAAQHASVKDYYMKMANRLAQPLLDMGLTEKDIGLYMQNKRIENDPSLNDTDRGILNPNGLTAEDATLALDELHRQLGDEKWNALEKWHRDFWQLRQETIIQMMEDSGAYSRELLDHVRDNEWYAYRKIISTLYGKDGAAHDNGSAKIYGLKGTVSDAANPLSWTFENDLRIMGGILWNTARMRTVDLMQQFFPNMIQKPGVEGRMTNGRLVMKDAPDGFTRMYVLREGKLEQWDVADAFAVGFSGVVDEDLYSLMSGLSKVTNWFRMGWTTYSPTFFVNNVIRDYLSTYQNFTEKNSPGLLQWTKYWALGMKEAFGDEFGWTSAVIDEMERQNMFQSAQQGHGEIIRQGTELSRLMDKYQLFPTKQTIKQRFLGDSMNPFKMLATLMEHLVSATERGAKAGGYMAMQDRMSGLSTDEMRYHVVKHIGSPDFATRGTKTFVTNTLFVFSNAAIQGWSATLESAKANPRAYGMRWMATTGVATLLGWAMSSGALLAALRGMGMDDDDDLIKFLEWMKKMYGKITHYNRFNYACLPIGETDDGQAVYIRIPYAENSRVSAMIFNGMLEAAYNETPKSYGAFTETARAVGSMATNTNPIIAALLDLAMFGQGYNIYDRHYGRPKVKTEDFNAGGLWRAKGIGSYMYREYSPYNFLKWDPENPNFWYDLIGTTLGWGTLVRKSSAGEKEAKREQRQIKANKKVRAKKYRPF